MNLAQLKIQQKARVTRVLGNDILRKRLLDMGITPNTSIEIYHCAPMSDPLEIQIRGYRLSLRKKECERIEVEIDENV